jgi:alpha-beta hydrolase superfamily lysophospholipase
MPDFEIEGRTGRVLVRVWESGEPRHIAVLSHGYGEHIGRYEHVADRLTEHGAVVYGPDHAGHGRSEGDRALVEDFSTIEEDLHAVIERAREQHPELPMVLIGHSMGGLIALAYAQRHPDELDALVLSGPAVAINPALAPLLEMDEIPDIPIDPAILSRDPEVGRRYAEDELVYHGPFKKPTLIAMASAAQSIQRSPGLGELPVLWMHGELDQLVPLDAVRPVVEGVGGRLEVHVYPGAQHEIFNEVNKDEVLEHLTAFLDRTVAVGQPT